MSAWQAIAAAAQPETARLWAALRRPRAQQLSWLQECLGRNASSEFGRQHGFDRLRNVDDYRRAVPVRGFEELATLIDRVADGEPGVLTSDVVVAFEATGGSAGGRKLVPYTELSFDAFRAAILPWLGCLLSERPGISAGPAYVAASPSMRRIERLRSGRAVGLASEAEYLGLELSRELARVTVAPSVPMADFEDWRDETLISLLRAPDLTLISVWSPTFLARLLDGLEERQVPLLRRLRDLSETVVARRLERHFAAGTRDLTYLWPRLDTISMWTDAASADYARDICRRFPSAHIDRKALLSTESPMTVRLDQRRDGAVPALTSAFLEFLGSNGKEYLSDELHEGDSYRVVITTPGGLYRYDIGDEVTCCSVDGGIPYLRFNGRVGVVSDLVGEKLTESFVAHVLGSVGVPVMIVPQRSGTPFYEAWVDASDGDCATLEQQVDALLRRNPQYQYARQLGQLGAPRAVFCAGVHEHRRAALVARGVRWGDVKPTALVTDRSTLPAITARASA